jgi:hypothetical protein
MMTNHGILKPNVPKKEATLAVKEAICKATWDARYVGVLPHHATPTTLI